MLRLKLEKSHTRKYASPRPPLKISLKHDRMKELGSEVARQPNQPNQTQIQFTERGDLLWQKERPVRVLRKSIHVSHLTARIPICWMNVYQSAENQFERFRDFLAVFFFQKKKKRFDFLVCCGVRDDSQ